MVDTPVRRWILADERALAPVENTIEVSEPSATRPNSRKLRLPPEPNRLRPPSSVHPDGAETASVDV